MGSTTVRKPVSGLLAVVITAIAVTSGVPSLLGSSGAFTVVPLAAFAGLVLLALGLTRFESFVLLALAVRPSLDWTKAESASGGSSHNAALLALLVVVLGLLWLAGRKRAGQTTRPSLVETGLLLFAGAGLVSIVGSARPVASLLEFARIAAVVAMFVILRRMLLSGNTNMRRIVAAVYVSSILPLAAAAYQAASGQATLETQGFDRIRGTFLHPSPFASYLTLLIVMGAAIYPHLERRLRAAMLVLLAGCSVSLLLTYTRIAWLATIVGLVMVGLWQNRRMIAVLVGSLVVLALAVPSVTGRFADIEEERNPSGTAANSLVWRFDYWRDVAQLSAENPLTGIGLKMIEFTTEEGVPAHNDYVRAYVETGLLGLIMFIGLLFGMCRTARRALERTRTGLERGTAVGFAGCVGAYMVLSLTGNVFSQVVVLWYFAAFAATTDVISMGASASLTSKSDGCDQIAPHPSVPSS
jgi:O-antigen ligase